MTRDDEIFKGKTFSGLAKDIYQNSKTKDGQIKTLIGELQPLIKNLGDAVIIVPLIKEYMEIAVKNDDQIVKLAAVVQRMIVADTKIEGGEFTISDEEKKQLLNEVHTELGEIKKSTNSIDSKLDEQIESVKEKIPKPTPPATQIIKEGEDPSA